jgi:hypothetical protein
MRAFSGEDRQNALHAPFDWQQALLLLVLSPGIPPFPGIFYSATLAIRSQQRSCAEQIEPFARLGVIAAKTRNGPIATRIGPSCAGRCEPRTLVNTDHAETTGIASDIAQ